MTHLNLENLPVVNHGAILGIGNKLRLVGHNRRQHSGHIGIVARKGAVPLGLHRRTGRELHVDTHIVGSRSDGNRADRTRGTLARSHHRIVGRIGTVIVYKETDLVGIGCQIERLAHIVAGNVQLYGIAARSQAGKTLLLGIRIGHAQCKLIAGCILVVKAIDRRQIDILDSCAIDRHRHVIRAGITYTDRIVVIVGAQTRIGILNVERHGEFRIVSTVLLQRELACRPLGSLKLTALNRDLRQIGRRKIDLQRRTGRQPSVDNLLGIDIRRNLDGYTRGRLRRRSRRHTLCLVEVIGRCSGRQIGPLHNTADLLDHIVQRILIAQNRQFVLHALVVVTGQQRLARFHRHIKVKNKLVAKLQQARRQLNFLHVCGQRQLVHRNILVGDREILRSGINLSMRLFHNDFQIVISILHPFDCRDTLARREIKIINLGIVLVNLVYDRFDINRITTIVFELIGQRHGRRRRFSPISSVIGIVLFAGCRD